MHRPDEDVMRFICRVSVLILLLHYGSCSGNAAKGPPYGDLGTAETENPDLRTPEDRKGEETVSDLREVVSEVVSEVEVTRGWVQKRQGSSGVFDRINDIAVSPLSGERVRVFSLKCSDDAPTVCEVRTIMLGGESEEAEEGTVIWTGGSVTKLNAGWSDTNTTLAWWISSAGEVSRTLVMAEVTDLGIRMRDFSLAQKVWIVDVSPAVPGGGLSVILETTREQLLATASNPFGCETSNTLLSHFSFDGLPDPPPVLLADRRCVGVVNDCDREFPDDSVSPMVVMGGLHVARQGNTWKVFSADYFGEAGIFNRDRCYGVLMVESDMDSGTWTSVFWPLSSLEPIPGGYVGNSLHAAVVCRDTVELWMSTAYLHWAPGIPGYFFMGAGFAREHQFVDWFRCGLDGTVFGSYCVGDTIVSLSHCRLIPPYGPNFGPVEFWSWNTQRDTLDSLELHTTFSGRQLSLGCDPSGNCVVGWVAGVGPGCRVRYSILENQ
jgi:hypothetical protein